MKLAHGVILEVLPVITQAMKQFA